MSWRNAADCGNVTCCNQRRRILLRYYGDKRDYSFLNRLLRLGERFDNLLIQTVAQCVLRLCGAVASCDAPRVALDLLLGHAIFCLELESLGFRVGQLGPAEIHTPPRTIPP